MSKQQRTPEENARLVSMFGCTIETLEAFLVEHVEECRPAEDTDPTSYYPIRTIRDAALSMLSDAQEMIARGRAEQARQTINRAKWLIDRIPPARR